MLLNYLMLLHFSPVICTFYLFFFLSIHLEIFLARSMLLVITGKFIFVTILQADLFNIHVYCLTLTKELIVCWLYMFK